MPKKRYKAEQVIPILREVEKGSISIEKVLKKYGIKEPTYYRWRKKYGGNVTGSNRPLGVDSKSSNNRFLPGLDDVRTAILQNLSNISIPQLSGV